MATSFHNGVSHHYQARSLIPSFALLATSSPPGIAKYCLSTPFEQYGPPLCKQCNSPSSSKQCSPLRVQRAAAASKEFAGVQAVKTLAKYDEKELPPLLASLAIEGLPPCQESMFADEALACILMSRPTDLLELESYYNVCNSYISFLHCGTASVDRLAAVSALCTVMTVMDDILFDSQDGVMLKKLGIDASILGSPERIREYLHSLDVLFRQEEEPQNSDRIQDMVWKLGCDFREMSDPEWFRLCSDATLDFFYANHDSYCANLVGDSTNFTDLESYTQMRTRTTGGRLPSLFVEFCNNLFLPTEIREHPVIQQLSIASHTYHSYINDIFSYSKELIDESQHSFNLVNVLMDQGEGMLLPQAAWKAVNLINSIAHDFMELEMQLPTWEDDQWNSDVRRYVEGLKELMSGDLYWHSMNKRYRHSEAPFPELRDVNVSLMPKADRVKFVRKENVERYS
ncbi:hypothetical protein KC19_3G255600 [Ceratodon purpureus]|uniref:Terpene synthase n=1 Tax=Ceratodon purpureus TaxID=3225 RepID=A0A8T0IPF4_CERPU|nr:hypothetical protein KC19_3G255600 [Ceratodon purpureus]